MNLQEVSFKLVNLIGINLEDVQMIISEKLIEKKQTLKSFLASSKSLSGTLKGSLAKSTSRTRKNSSRRKGLGDSPTCVILEETIGSGKPQSMLINDFSRISRKHSDIYSSFINPHQSGTSPSLSFVN